MATDVNQLPERKDIAVEDTWRLEDIFATDQAWENEFKDIQDSLPKGEQYKGKLGESADVLWDALQFQDGITERLGRLYTYSHMRYDQDTGNTFYQGMDDRAKNLYSQASSVFSYIVPEILSIDEETINRFMEEKEELKLYEHVLKEINLQRPHVLSAEQEALLAQASEVLSASSNTFGMLNNADLRFPSIKDENGQEVELTHGRYTRFLESADRRVRKEAFEAMYKTYGQYKNTFASTLAGTVKKDNFYAKVRNYSSAREAALSANNIPESVYENLVGAIHDNLDLLHRYVRLRKKILGVEELHMYDLYTPLVQDVKMEIPYEDAKNYVLNGLAPLGEDYVSVLKEGVDLPAYAYTGDAGMDLRAAETVMLRPFQRVLVSTGLAIAIPEGYAGFVQPRSGLAVKHGITVLNTPGLIDSHYRGEIKVCLINMDPKNGFVINEGDRIAQLVIQKVASVEWEPVGALDATERGEGGFGSSGI